MQLASVTVFRLVGNSPLFGKGVGHGYGHHSLYCQCCSLPRRTLVWRAAASAAHPTTFQPADAAAAAAISVAVVAGVLLPRSLPQRPPCNVPLASQADVPPLPTPPAAAYYASRRSDGSRWWSACRACCRLLQTPQAAPKGWGCAPGARSVAGRCRWDAGSRKYLLKDARWQTHSAAHFCFLLRRALYIS